MLSNYETLCKVLQVEWCEDPISIAEIRMATINKLQKENESLSLDLEIEKQLAAALQKEIYRLRENNGLRDSILLDMAIDVLSGGIVGVNAEMITALRFAK